MENITDFDFYLKFTKTLILTLPKIDDRVLAAAWVKRLKDDSKSEEKIKLDYLKLLLFVLQRKRLTHPFTEHPNNLEDETLKEFPKNQTLVDVAKSIIEKEYEEKREKHKGEKGDFPPYISDFSADLLEYIAVQDIKNFGVHGYYAISKVPLSTWYRVDKQLFPKAAKSMIEVSPGPHPILERSSSDLPRSPTTTAPESPPQSPLTTSAEVSVEPPQEAPPEESPAESPEPEETLAETQAEASPPPKKSPSPKKSTLGSSPPSRPIGKIVPPSEEREPPSWGSNLLEVKHVLEEGEFGGLDRPSEAEVLWSSPFGRSTQQHDIFSKDFTDHGDASLFLDTSIPSFHGVDLLGEEEAAEGIPGSPYQPSPRQPTPRQPTPRQPTPRQPTPRQPTPRQPTPRQPTPRQPTPRQPTPRQPTPPAPPRRVARKPPVIRQTRSSLLLQKKTAAAGAPEPPPPKKKPGRKAPGKGKGKKPAIRAAESESEQLVTADLDQEELDDIDATLKELRVAVQEIQHASPRHQEHLDVASTESVEAAPQTTAPIRKSKKKLSGIAKRSQIGVPKAHGASVTLGQSIHISSEAREILEEVEAQPGPSGMEPPHSPLRAPLPRLPEGFIEEEEGEPQLAEGETDEVESEEPEIETHVQKLRTSPGPGKDQRVSQLFDAIAATSIRIEGDALGQYDQAAVEALGLEGGLGLEDLQVDIANISGNLAEIDQALSRLQTEAAAPEAAAPEAAAAVNVLVAAAPAAEAAEPAAPAKAPAKKKSKKAIPVVRQTKASRLLQMKKGAQPPPPEKKKVVKKKKSKSDVPSKEQLEHEKRVQEAMDEGDFEEVERLIEEEMQRKGEDPKTRAKQVSVSKKSKRSGLRKFVKVHSRAEAQLMELEDEEERKLDLQQQLEDLYRRLQPNVPPSQRTPPLFSKHQAIRDVAAQMVPYEAGDEHGDFVSGEEFFKGTKYSPRPDYRSKPPEFVFPEIEFGAEGGFGAEDDLMEFLVPGSPDKKKQLLDEIESLYAHLVESSPAITSGVPATTPKPSASPRRVRDAHLFDGMPAPELVSPEQPDSPTDAFGLPHVNISPYFSIEERKRWRSPPPRPERRPDTPRPHTPSPRTPKGPPPDESMFYTTPPNLETSPEPVDLESPPKQYHEPKPIPFQYAEDQLSPHDPGWRDKRDELRRKLYGTPKTPTVFDIPVERVAGETPPRLAEREHPPLSPPIDAAQLRAHIQQKMPLKYDFTADWPVYKGYVVDNPLSGKQRVVNRYSHPGPMQRTVVPEVSDQLPLEDIEMQEELKKFEKVKTRRPIERLTKRETQTKTLPRHSIGTPFRPITEVIEPTPPKEKPDVFDIPPMFQVGGESPPRDVFQIPPTSPPVSPTNIEEWKGAVSSHSKREYNKSKHVGKFRGRRLDMRSAPPKIQPVSEAIEDLGPEEWEHLGAIHHSAWPDREFKKKKLPELGMVEEYIEYSSPLSRREEDVASPRSGRGPRRRSVRKRLSKRRIDFSQPESPDESEIHVEEVDTVVDEREIPSSPTEIIPEYTPPQVMRTPPKARSPRTPTQRVDIEEAPEDLEGVFEWSPASPLCEYGVLEGTMAEVKEHKLVPRRRRRRRIIREMLDEIDEENKLQVIQEAPLEEKGAMIRNEIEAEVEAELQAKENEEKAKYQNYLDRSLPPGLPSPLKPEKHVPFYQTPPHLKRPQHQLAQVVPQVKIYQGAFKEPLVYERMPELPASPVLPSPPAFTTPPSPKPSPQPLDHQEGVPEGFASPLSPATAADVEQLAQMQYNQLLSPEEIAQQQQQQQQLVPIEPFELSPQRDYAQRYADLEPPPCKSPECPNRFEAEESERRASTPARVITVAAAGPEQGSPADMAEFEQLEAMAEEEAAAGGTPPFPVYVSMIPEERYQQLASAQYASLGDSPEYWEEGASLPYMTPPYPRVTPPPPGKPTPPRRGRRGPAVRQTRSSQLLQKKAAAGAAPPPAATKKGKAPAVRATGSKQQLQKKPSTAAAAAPPPAAKKGKPLAVRQTRSSMLLQKKAAEAKKAELSKKKPKRKGSKATVLTATASTSETQVPPPAADVAPPHVSPQPEPSSRSDPIEFEYSETVVEVKPKSMEEEQKGKRQIEYDVEALQRLGITHGDLRILNLDDLPRPPTSPQRHPLPLPIRQPSPGSPSPEHMRRTLEKTEGRMHPVPVPAGEKFLPTRYKYMRPKLHGVTESEEEYKTPPRVGWDMHWDLPPEKRIELRAGDVKVLPSPLKESRLQFERVNLESPPRQPAHPLLPLAIPPEQAQMYPHIIDVNEDINVGIGFEQMPVLESGLPDPGIFDKLERLEETEGTADRVDQPGFEQLGFETVGADVLQPRTPPRSPFVYQPPAAAPSPPHYESPPRQPSPPRQASPTQPGAELRVEEEYDEEEELWRALTEVSGTVPAVELPAGARTYGDVVATADAQYAELMADSPQPTTPERQTEEQRPSRLSRSHRRKSRRPDVELDEVLEEDLAESAETAGMVHIAPPPIVLQPEEQDYSFLGEQSPPSHYASPQRQLPETWEPSPLHGQVSPGRQLAETWEPSPQHGPHVSPGSQFAEGWEPSPMHGTPQEYYSPLSPRSQRRSASPGYRSPVSARSPGHAAAANIWDESFTAGDVSPLSYTSPPHTSPAHVPPAKYRAGMPTPVRPQRIQEAAPRPLRLSQELPEPIIHPKPVKLSTPSPKRPTKSVGQPPSKRKIDFDQLPPSPGLSEGPVQVLTVGQPTALEQTAVDIMWSPSQEVNNPFGPGHAEDSPMWNDEIFDMPDHELGFRWMDM